LLLQYGANANATTHNGTTPLHLSVSSDNIELPELLLRHGANVNAANSGGFTALHMCCRCDEYEKYSERIKLLLRHRADTTLCDERGKTALSYLYFYQAIELKVYSWLN